jgi:hypothetical protein
MIFQAYIGSTGVATLNVPFTGRYHIKLVKIDYHNVGVFTQELIQLTSQTLINQTPLSGRILFINNTNNWGYGDSFVIGQDVMINGMIDFDLKTFGGAALPATYDSVVITLDFVKAN